MIPMKNNIERDILNTMFESADNNYPTGVSRRSFYIGLLITFSAGNKLFVFKRRLRYI